MQQSRCIGREDENRRAGAFSGDRPAAWTGAELVGRDSSRNDISANQITSSGQPAPEAK